MATVRIRPGQLGARFKADAKNFSRAINRGMKAAAMRGKRLLVKKTPVGAFANMRDSWVVLKDGTAYILENTAPYAGVVEGGARPHPVSQEGIEAIAHWAVRKLGMDALDAENLAWGVAKRLKAEGQPGTFFIKDSLPELAAFLNEEINRALAKTIESSE